jgi:hypothetical protein
LVQIDEGASGILCPLRCEPCLRQRLRDNLTDKLVVVEHEHMAPAIGLEKVGSR